MEDWFPRTQGPRHRADPAPLVIMARTEGRKPPESALRELTPLLHHFAQYVAVDEVLGTSGGDVEGGGHGDDAKVAVQGGEDLAERHRPVAVVLAQAVDGSDALPRHHAAARQQSAADLRP